MPKLFVAHYGHPLLKGAKHWALLLPNPSGEDYAAYQITGSTQTYKIKPVENVKPEQSRTFMGMVEVGDIAANQRQALEQIALTTPVVRGDVSWNCQNWIITVLASLKAEGFRVTDYSLKDLQDLLAERTE